MNASLPQTALAPFANAQARPVRAPRGSAISCANWQIEAAYRMIQNNLDPEVAENPDQLVVYGGIGKAARNRWPQLLRGPARSTSSASKAVSTFACAPATWTSRPPRWTRRCNSLPTTPRAKTRCPSACAATRQS